MSRATIVTTNKPEDIAYALAGTGMGKDNSPRTVSGSLAALMRCLREGETVIVTNGGVTVECALEEVEA